MFQSVDELAWGSHHVVVGTVVEVLPAQKVMVEGSVLPFTIVTDVLVQVEQQFRGQPADTLRVRTLGGRIGECSQEFPDSPHPAAGTRALLFLRKRDIDTPAGEQVYDFTGGEQGYWPISADSFADTRAVHLLPAGDPVLLTTVEETIAAALAAGPPESPLLEHYFLVPIDEAPIAPGILPTPSAIP